MKPELLLSISKLLSDVFGKAADKIRVDDGVAVIALELVDGLQPREKACICLVYGITGQAKSLRQTGSIIGKIANPEMPVSPERVRQLLAKAKRKLRHPRRSEKIMGLLEAVSQWDRGVRPEHYS